MWSWAETSASRTSNHLFDLLLWPQLVGVSTLLLTAVGGTRVQPGIAPVKHMQRCWQHVVTALSTHSIACLPSSYWECHTAKHIQRWCSASWGVRVQKGMSHSIWPQALANWQQEAKWWKVSVVRWIIRLPNMSRRYWETNFTTWWCMTSKSASRFKEPVSETHVPCMYACMLFA